jgi:hypothetical protein
LIVALLYSAGAMAQVINARPMDFWDPWCPSAVEVVVGRGDFVVEMVDGEFDYAVAMVVAEAIG